MLALTKITHSQDIFFVLIVLSFLLIALIKGVYWKHAKLLFMGVFAQRYANQYLRQENAFTERVSFLTFLLMNINFTLIIAKFQEVMGLRAVFSLFSLVAVFFLLKLIVIKTLGFLFKVQDLAKLAVFFSLLFDKTLAFVLSPLVVMLYFFSFEISSAILIVSLCLFIVFLILKLFWLWKMGANSFGLSQVYIFLYLCFLEFFPLLLLAKGTLY
tara:strand:- start:451 stop:1092 length:642 start_codon:yes stop_codon:yes gene_type:complete